MKGVSNPQFSPQPSKQGLFWGGATPYLPGPYVQVKQQTLKHSTLSSEDVKGFSIATISLHRG